MALYQMAVGFPTMKLFRQQNKFRTMLSATWKFEIADDRINMHCEGRQGLIRDRVGLYPEG